MENVSRSRRAFLLPSQKKQAQLRPPWSQQESQFIDICTRCNACVENCETNIIVKGSGGFPEVDFNLGECTTCGLCVDNCPTDALNRQQVQFDNQITIKDSCFAQNQVYCQSCKDSCEPQAIKFSFSQGAIPVPSLNTDLCNSCGACVSACPQNAIEILPTATE